MQVELKSPCKVNLILNILGKRADGFHELETVMHPVAIHDVVSIERAATGIELTCDQPDLPTDSRNLAHRAATAFFNQTGIRDGARIHLAKRIPMEAGLGGGSGNAATTLLGLNEIFGQPLESAALQEVAATLGSDVPFFLQSAPAIAFGRGEKVRSLSAFECLKRCYFLLIHPCSGVSTPWAYKNLVRFPSALQGERGRAQRLVESLGISLGAARADFYNSLDAPVLEKFPLLAIFQDFLRESGAEVALMSGSGSTTFGIFSDRDKAERVKENFKTKFGDRIWLAAVEVGK